MTIKELFEKYPEVECISEQGLPNLLGFACQVRDEIKSEHKSISAISDSLCTWLTETYPDESPELILDVLNKVTGKIRRIKRDAENDFTSSELNDEVWKTVYDPFGNYEVSSLGRARRKSGKRLLTPIVNKKGYLEVSMKGGSNYKKISLHRLVATMFIPNPDNLPYVNHIDENPMNCRVSNLEWISPKGNANHGTSRERIAINLMNGCACYKDGKKVKEFESRKSAAEWLIATGQTKAKRVDSIQGLIGRVIHSKQQEAYGYVWKDIEE